MVHWATVRRLRKPSSKWTKGRSCTNIQPGPLKWGRPALAPKGVIEFVPKQDPMVQELLRNREDIFPDYTKESFSEALGRCATIRRVAEVSASGRSLFWFERD